jgi:hypothetical protein
MHLDHLGVNAGKKDGGYDWNAGGRVGFSGDGKTYIGPTYSGGGAGNKFGGGSGHIVGVEARHYSGDTFTSFGVGKGLGGGGTHFRAGFGFKF